MKHLYTLIRYTKPYYKNVIYSILSMFVQVAAGFVIPLLMITIIDQAIPNGDTTLLLQTSAIMVGVALFGLVTGLFNNYNSQKVAMFSTADLRVDLFAKIQSLSFNNIDHFKTSRLITTATNDITRIQQFYQMLLRILVRAPLMMIVGTIFAIQTSRELSQLFYISVPMLIISFVVIMIIAFPKFSKVQKTVDGLNKVTLETANAPRVIKSFVTSKEENDKFEAANELFRVTNTSANKIMAFAEPIIMFIFNASLGGIIALGAYYLNTGDLISNGTRQVGLLIAFNNYSSQILFGLLMFAMMMIFMSRASVSAKRIMEVFDETIDLENLPNAISDVSLTGEIEFKNVGFGYGTDGNRVLRDISFKVNPGETVGIIGSTGSGKTSLIHLIPRLYDVCEGGIYLNGINVKELDVDMVRSQISVVTQTATIFSGSIGTNIRQGKNDASYSEFDEATGNAVATEFITDYEDLYNHKIEQNGANLSGGQKQRISLSRAFIRQPKILILDDSTSAVDAKSEEAILASIKKLSKNMTSLIISQKVSTIRDMDKIIVLNNKGKLDGFGTHDELIKSSKVYQEIALSQLGNGGGLDGKK